MFTKLATRSWSASQLLTNSRLGLNFLTLRGLTMSSPSTVYPLAPSLHLFEESTNNHRCQTCKDIDGLCNIIIANQNLTKGRDESSLSPRSQLPGLRSAVDALGGPEVVFDFANPDGLYQRLIGVAAELQTLFPSLAIPTLSRQGGNGSTVELSARQIRCVLANALLGNLSRIPLPNANAKHHRPMKTIPHYGSLSWHLVFDSSSPVATARVKGLLLYFQQALYDDDDDDSRTITFRRLAVDNKSFSLASRLAETKKLTPVSFFQGGVELAPGADAMVDFANEDLHVGAVWPCATQEEILFTIHPECFAGILFSETMDVNEAIQICDVRAYCETTGFQDTFKVKGPAFNKKPKTILAMDASIADWGYNRISDQCSGPNRNRDILKAVAAFSRLSDRTVATGSWGCGAFGGDIYVKFLVQWIAASLCNVSLLYCLVGRESDMIEKDLKAIADCLCEKQWTPEKVFRAMADYRGPESSEGMRLFVLKTFTQTIIR